ncbi:RDD family protein [Alteromonas sp. SM 2104]|nr:RDD family protein [Alteromonas oceanisediminis]
MLVTGVFLRTTFKLARQHRYPRTRIALNIASAGLVFLIVVVLAEALRDDEQYTQTHGEQAILATAAFVEWQACDSLLCKQSTLETFSEAFAQTTIREAQFSLAAQELINDDAELTGEQRQSFLFIANTVFHQTRAKQGKDAVTLDSEDELSISTQPEDKPAQAGQYSLIAWLKGFATDLGLGFGWAALYFSTLTAWFNGATVGKRLVGICVVRLDGKTPSLWESFGRYGGYGAGLATGLLGFLQIYWDANRQAIQDKISETLVLRLQSERSSQQREENKPLL